ncbi:CLUMA_CG020376, isoform A [Clunio marinus]|uniref:CLUMA_CG020376, isoform A n=1 Tax=Clunio marinus TaxID=568069 RepID=A0A1J1J4S2_9DIPT|nr:CLUMA_CG020376, isoform A [Clunio marinus]
MNSDLKYGVQIIKEIGSGGFGKVFKCVYKGKEHALKKIPMSYESLPYKTVVSEWKILSNIKHPRIVKLVLFYQSKIDWNFLLEYVKHGSLRDIIRSFIVNSWKFGQGDLLSLFMDIAMGIRFLHSKSIIHRDLKPENVLVDENHRLKIADFGIAKSMIDNVATCQTSVGTITYMAPEVYLHQPYDKKVDVWALGIIFYEMAMMKYPFTKADKARIMNPNLSFRPPIIDFQRRNYSPHVQDFLVLMLQRNPQKRSNLESICRAQIVEKIFLKLHEEETRLMSNF